MANIVRKPLLSSASFQNKRKLKMGEQKAPCEGEGLLTIPKILFYFITKGDWRPSKLERTFIDQSLLPNQKKLQECLYPLHAVVCLAFYPTPYLTSRAFVTTSCWLLQAAGCCRCRRLYKALQSSPTQAGLSPQSLCLNHAYPK